MLFITSNHLPSSSPWRNKLPSVLLHIWDLSYLTETIKYTHTRARTHTHPTASQNEDKWSINIIYCFPFLSLRKKTLMRHIRAHFSLFEDFFFSLQWNKLRRNTVRHSKANHILLFITHITFINKNASHNIFCIDILQYTNLKKNYETDQ